MDKREYATQIAEKIQSLADSKGVSISQMLKACGAQQNFMNHIANQGSIPAVNRLVPIADYFGVSVDYLIGHDASKADDSGVLSDMHGVFMKLGVTDDSIERGEFLGYMETQAAAYLSLKRKKNWEAKAGGR
jgi:transcriptional regulator with XRE-family HTH domain